MKVLRPADGTHLPISQVVLFEGTADPNVARVQLFADTSIELGTVFPTAQQWTFARKFSKPGVRQIDVIGLNENNEEVGRTSISINLRLSQAFGYTPPEKTLPHLGEIAGLLETATPIDRTFAPLDHVEALFKLTGSSEVLYFESNLDLDTDGKESPGIVYEPTHQSETSLRHPNAESLDSNTTPFFVLPGIHDEVKPTQVKLGGMIFSLGDIGTVLFQNRIEFAIFGDMGPKKKIGEGSIALHRALGHETIKSNGHIRDEDIVRDVVTIVFPGSGDGTPQTPESIRQKGRALFNALGGVAP